MYPGDSCTGKFHGAAKLHKVDLKGQIGNLPIKPIQSNINTSSYNHSEHKVLALLRESIKNTKIL